MSTSENGRDFPPRSPQGDGLLEWLSARLNLTEVFSVLTSFGLFYAEVDNRKPLREALAEVMDRPSPSYARGLRVLGLVVVVLLALELVTGTLLAFYYLPTPESAHASVGTIMRDVHFGWLVHQVHFWGAQLLIAVLIVRLLRFLLARVFEPPRELFWVLAAMLLLVCFHIDMTGRLLPWTANAYWSGVRALEIVQSVPIYGTVAAFVLGFDETFVSSLTLIRAYVLHVGVLPAVALVLIYLHFSTVRRVGLSGIAGEIRYSGGQLLKRHTVNLTILLVAVLGVLVSLAILTPTTYEPEADPFATLPGVGPAWYLLAPFGFLELTSALLPQWLAGLLLFLAFVVFLLLPFVRRRGRRAGSGADPISLVVTLVLLVVWLALTFYGAQVV